MTAITTTQKSPSTASGTGITKADKKAAEKKANPNVGRTKPWVDLVADVEKIAAGPAPREKTVLFCMNGLLKERGREGATFDEIRASFPENLRHHDPATLCRWANKERGFGYHQKKDGRIVLRMKAEE